MKRLVYMVSGTPQWEGYSDEVIKIAKNIGLTGYVHNLMDGSAKVVAEEEEEKLWLFEERANLRKRYIFSEATGEFSDFYKLEGEADEKMKEIIALLKELIEVWGKGVSDIHNVCWRPRIAKRYVLCGSREPLGFGLENPQGFGMMNADLFIGTNTKHGI